MGISLYSVLQVPATVFINLLPQEFHQIWGIRCSEVEGMKNNRTDINVYISNNLSSEKTQKEKSLMQ
jgi:hypothetical protein